MYSQIGTPNTPSTSSYIRIVRLNVFCLRLKLLLQYSQLGSILVDTDICTTHATLAVKGRSAVQNAMIVDNYTKRCYWVIKERKWYRDSPTAVPADN